MDFVNHSLFIVLRWLSQPGSVRKSQDQMVEKRPIKILIKTTQNSLCVGQSLSRVCLAYLPRGLWPTRLLCPWVLRARILEWVAIPVPRGSSWPSDRTQASCTVGRFFTAWAPREALEQSSLFCFYNGNNYAFRTSMLLLWRENNEIFFNSKCQRTHARIYFKLYLLLKLITSKIYGSNPEFKLSFKELLPL